MQKKLISLILILPILLALAGCSSLSNIKLPWVKATTAAQNQALNFADQPVENKLAIGLLKLEGTGNAVTAEQAKTLLPLWQAVKGLSTGNSTTADEMTALYQQIQDALTAEQVQAIKDLNLTQDDLQALMKQYNVQFPQGGPGGANGGQIPSAAQTQMAQRRASGDTGGFPGGGPGGGMPPDGSFPGGPGGTRGQAGPGSASGQTAQGTPQPGQGGRGFRGGMNTLFVDPLISLLEQRAGA